MDKAAKKITFVQSLIVFVLSTSASVSCLILSDQLNSRHIHQYGFQTHWDMLIKLSGFVTVSIFSLWISHKLNACISFNKNWYKIALGSVLYVLMTYAVGYGDFLLFPIWFLIMHLSRERSALNYQIASNITLQIFFVIIIILFMLLNGEGLFDLDAIFKYLNLSYVGNYYTLLFLINSLSSESDSN